MANITFVLVHNKPWIYGTSFFDVNLGNFFTNDKDTDVFIYGVDQFMTVLEFAKEHPDAFILYPAGEHLFSDIPNTYCTNFDTVSNVIERMLYIGQQQSPDPEIRQLYKQLFKTYLPSQLPRLERY